MRARVSARASVSIARVRLRARLRRSRVTARRSRESRAASTSSGTHTVLRHTRRPPAHTPLRSGGLYHLQSRACAWQTTGNSEVTKVRIMGDSRENERRISEEVNRQGRRQKLLYEAESSARQVRGRVGLGLGLSLGVGLGVAAQRGRV